MKPGPLFKEGLTSMLGLGEGFRVECVRFGMSVFGLPAHEKRCSGVALIFVVSRSSIK